MVEKAPAMVTDVAEYYDDIGELVEIVGGKLHVGYWAGDEDETPFLEAMNKLTEMIAERLLLRQGQHVLDVGCGVGEPAIRLAQRHDVSITGITLSHWQVEEATRRVIAAGLRGRVAITWADAGALPFPEEEFDAAVAFDALPNAEDKQLWLGEIFRVLRPGARFVFSEYPAVGELTPAERETLRANAIPNPPADLSEVVAQATATGFEVDEDLDCGDHVRRWYDEFLTRLAQQRSGLVSAYGEDRIGAFEKGITAMFELCREKLGYFLVTCHKPGQ